LLRANHRPAGRLDMSRRRMRRWGRPALTIVLSLLLVATPILDALPPGLSVAFADPGTYCRVTPSTFNPYEDGYATISWDYYNEHPTEITLEQSGQVLAVLGTGTYGVGDHTKTWNGTIRGQIAPEGTYRICVTPTDEWSEWGKCASVTIVHPPAPSAPTITSYPRETGVRQIRVGGFAGPNLSIQVYLNGHPAGSASSDAQGSWRAYVNLPEEENARHALQARARDPRTGKVSGLSGTAFVHFSLVYYEREGYDGKEVASEFGPDTASGTHSDPVNTSTGNFTHSRLDLMLPGHPQLEWSAHYNSLDRVPGILGVGWRTSLTQRFQKTANGAVIVFREDGRRDYFRRDEDGVYRAGPGVFDELTFNPDGSAVLKAERDHSRLFFHADGRLDRIEDRNGRTVNLVYQQVGSKYRLVKVENSSGRWLSFSYNSQGLLAQVSDSAERSVSYQYSAAGDLVRVIDPRGSVTTYQYNAAHQITAIGDGDGHTLLGNEYDNSERVARQTDADGYTTTFTYHLTERKTIITEPNGQQITDEFDEYYRLVRRVDAAGRVTEYGYDDFGHRSRFDLPGDRQVRREYSAEGRLLRLVDAAGNWTSFNYNEEGDLVEMVDPGGNSTHFRYDENHNLVAVELAGGATTSFAYDQRGNLLTRTDPLGNTTRFSYNHRDELISMTDPLGRVTAFSYDDAGRLTGLEEPGDRVTTLQYDAAGNLLSVTRPTGATISYNYDQRGRPLAVTDGEGNTTRYRFDHRNLLRAVEDPLGRETAFSYDALGNLTSRVDKAGFITRFEYDALGQLVKLVDPLGAATTLTYNEAGDLIRRELPEGQVEAWSYDKQGQVTTYTDPTGAVVHLDYDSAGNLTAVTDPLGRKTLRQYDELNRLIGITNPLGEKESFNYDSAGQLVSWFGGLGSPISMGMTLWGAWSPSPTRRAL